MWVGLSLANAEANAVRVEKDRITSYRLSLSLSPSLQTDVATYRAAYGLSPLSIISLWLFVGNGAVLKMALRLYRRSVLALIQNVTRLGVVSQYWGVTANGIVPVPKVCTGAVLDLVPKETCLYYTEKNS